MARTPQANYTTFVKHTEAQPSVKTDVLAERMGVGTDQILAWKARYKSYKANSRRSK